MATAAALAALVSVTAAPPAAAATTPALDLLSRLPVREQSTTPFDASAFPVTNEPYTCTAASYALIRDSEIQATVGPSCQITNGRWRSYYEGAAPKTYTDASQLGVVQTVPALEAWRSGAQSWGPGQRRNFMEDLTLPAALVVAPLAVIQQRQSTDPDVWGPPSSASACRYAVEWTQVKYRWGLSVDQREHDRLQRWLSTCGGVAVQVPAPGGEGQQQTGDPSGDGSPAGSDRLRYQQVLRSGEWLMSPNRTYGLTMQPDGNLVAYGPNRRVLWSADTYGNPGATFHINSRWELEVTSRDGRALWHTAAFSIGGAAEVRVQDDGNVVLYRDDKTVAWYTGWDRTGMRGGEDLLPGQRITSANGRYFLTFQADGNIVVYTAGGRPVWFSGTYGAARLTFQPDGNLVAYRGSPPRALWSTDTWRAGPSRLQVQDDGNVVIYRGDNGRAVWYSGWDTGQSANRPSGGTTIRGDGRA